MPMDTDLELLHSYVHAGEERAFQEIVLRYQCLVMGVARTHLRGADCEDVVQETFLTLATRAASIKSHLAAWLYSTARNHTLHLVRREGRQHRDPLNDDQMPDRPQPDDDMDADLLSDLDAAMALLSEAERDLLLQRYCSGRTLADIAHDQNRSIAAIHGRIESALAKLRRHLRKADASTPVIALGALISIDPPARLLPLVMKPVLGGTLHAKMAAGTSAITAWMVALGLAVLAVTGLTWYLWPIARTPGPVLDPAGESGPRSATSAAAPVGDIDPSQIAWSAEALAHYARGEPVPVGSKTASGWQVQDFMKASIGDGGNRVITKEMAPLWHVPAGSQLERVGQDLRMVQPKDAKAVCLFGGRTWAPRWQFEISVSGASKKWSLGVRCPQTVRLDLKEPVGTMPISSAYADPQPNNEKA